MKKSKFIRNLLIILIMTMFTVNVYAVEETKDTEGAEIADETKEKTGKEDNDAEEDKDKEEEEIKENWSDLSDIKMEIISDKSGVKLKISSISLEKLNEHSLYAMYISNEKGAEFTPDNSTENQVGAFSLKSIRDDKITEFNHENVLLDYIERNANMYISIIEDKNDESDKTKKVLADYELKRPNLLPLGQRIQSYFFNDKTSTFLNEPHKTKDRKINLKIGKVTDNNILLSIKNGEKNCLQKLMNYAKNSQSIYTGTVALGESNSITSKMDLVDEAYYYVYMEMDDESGKYYQIEDISLYQAVVGDTRKMLFDYLSSDFKWNLGNAPLNTDNNNKNNEDKNNDNKNVETSKNDNSVANKIIPKTGLKSIIAVICVLMAVSAFCLHKYNKFKDIK